MHEDDGLAEPRNRRQHIRVQHAGRDIVDDVRACGAGGFGDARAVSVDAEGDVRGFRERADVADCGDYAGDFCGSTYGL